MGSDPQPLTSIEIKKKEQAYKDAHDIEIDKRIAKDLVGAERTQGPGFSKLEVLSKLDTVRARPNCPPRWNLSTVTGIRQGTWLAQGLSYHTRDRDIRTSRNTCS